MNDYNGMINFEGYPKLKLLHEEELSQLLRQLSSLVWLSILFLFSLPLLLNYLHEQYKHLSVVP